MFKKYQVSQVLLRGSIEQNLANLIELKSIYIYLVLLIDKIGFKKIIYQAFNDKKKLIQVNSLNSVNANCKNK